MVKVLTERVDLVKGVDTGYTVICPVCSLRSGERSELIGKPRTLDHVVCDDHIDKQVQASLARARRDRERAIIRNANKLAKYL